MAIAPRQIHLAILAVLPVLISLRVQLVDDLHGAGEIGNVLLGPLVGTDIGAIGKDVTGKVT